MHPTPIQVARHVGTQIKLRRRLAGLTPDQLADRAGLSVETVKAIEAGVASATVIDVAQLAAALDCDPAALFIDGAIP